MLPLRRLLLISRPLGYLPSVAIFGAGIANQHATVSWSTLFLAAYFTMPFGLVAYGINDISDRQSDAQNKRKGGIDGARLAAAEVSKLWPLIIATIVIAPLLLLLTHHIPAAMTVIVLSLVAIAYSLPPLRLKSRPGLDSLSNALGIILIYLTGTWAAERRLSHLEWPSPHLLLAIGLFAFAFHALGAVADHETDKAAHEYTLSIGLGRRPTLAVCAMCYAACFWLVGRSHWLTGAYLLLCTLVTALVAAKPTATLVRNVGLGILLVFPFAILPAIL